MMFNIKTYILTHRSITKTGKRWWQNKS